MIMPIGQAILAQAAGPQRMGRVMSVIGVPTLLGPILGPVIGGLIVDNFSWRWIFFVNLPVGAVALALACADPAVAPSGDTRGRGSTWPGCCCSRPGSRLLVYGLSEVGMPRRSFDATTVLVGLIAGAGLLVGVRAARRRGRRARADRPARCSATGRSPPRRERRSSSASSLFGAMLILPLYYQVVRGESALVAGLLLAPQGIGAAMAMPIAGRLTDRRRRRADRTRAASSSR